VTTTDSTWTLDRARSLDAEDPIGDVRKRFSLPPGVIYLNGNSLGPLPRTAGSRVRRTVEDEWGASLSSGWTGQGWMDAPQRLGDRIAPLIGAGPGEVLVADTTSVALAKLLGAALAARPERHTVVSSSDNFPSDLYVAAGVARRAGASLKVVDRAELAETLDGLAGDVAVCCLTQVDFRTGALLDLPAVTEAVHAAGALALWDLCHSAGVVPVGCETNGVDLAVGCTYKYLSAGPGAPSFVYVRRALQEPLDNPIPGWLGHADPFGFDLRWEPARGIRKFLTSTPPVLALSALDAALDIFGGVAIEQVREKSMALGELFVEVVETAAVPGLELASPREPHARGAQVSLRHPRAAELLGAAAARGVVGDLRPPSLCRFGLAPLALSFEDVFNGATAVVDAARSLE
jgi:kynureninase